VGPSVTAAASTPVLDPDRPVVAARGTATGPAPEIAAAPQEPVNALVRHLRSGPLVPTVLVVGLSALAAGPFLLLLGLTGRGPAWLRV
jgi:hypothetical protein